MKNLFVLIVAMFAMDSALCTDKADSSFWYYGTYHLKTKSEIATYLGVRRDTVYRWIDRHSMPAHKIGRLWKFKKDEVDEWVKTGGASTFDSESKK